MNMIGYIIAIKGAFIQQWKEVANSLMNLGYFVGSIPTSAVVAWVGMNSGNPGVLTYLLIAGPLVHVWNGVVLRVGWSLDDEMWEHTLEFALTSRTPLIMVLFGKALAQLAYGIPTGLTAFLSMLVVVRQVPPVADIPSLFFSLVLIVVSIAVTSLLMAPLVVLVGGRGGFFNAIMGLGVLISGFMVPIDNLPLGFAVAARFLPTSWAMNAVWKSITGYDTYWSILGNWGGCILASAIILGITFLLFRAVEKRIRITGALSVN